ncbi:MAG: TadE/TadG family type IV pilus assembly protein [Candidatus Limnocylindrales bacterium]
MLRWGARQGRKRSRGQTLVEFAIVMPIIALTVLGLVDLSRAVYSYNTLAQSARQAARMAIVNQNLTNVRNQAITSAPSLGLTTSNIDVCFKTSATTQQNCASTADNCPQSTRVIGCLALVRTHMDYRPMTPIISLIWSSIPLSSTSVGTIENVCPIDTATTCP